MPLDADSTRHGRLTFSLSGPVIGLIGVLAVFCLILAIQGDLGHFVQLSNLQTLLNRNSVNAAVALGMLLIIISGGIDLSSGSVVALVTVVAMQAYRHVEASTNSPGLASALAILSGIGTGALCGIVNGLVITQLRVLPFVATLGMYSVARGLAFWLAGRTRISFRGQRPGWIEALSQARSDYLFDPGVWIVAAIAIAVAILLRNTVFGRYCYAIGSNEETARLCGVSVNRQKILIYTLAGLLTGLAGILVFAHTQSGDPSSGTGLELEVIAAVVIGGASLSGGQGTVGGALLGVLILGILENGVSFFSVPVEVKYILIGVIVVINTALSGWQRARRG